MINRRTFIRSAGGSLLLVELELFLITGCSNGPPSEQLIKRAQAFFNEDEGARRLGRHWLKHHPEEGTRPALGKALVDSLPEGSYRIGPFLERLTHSISEDFLAGRTTYFDGWLLAHTEMRFYALVELLAR